MDLQNVQLNKTYISTLPSVLKCLQLLFSLLSLILSSSAWWNLAARGFCIFASVLAILITLTLYMLHIFNLVMVFKIPMVLIELISLCLCFTFAFISMIVSAVWAPIYNVLVAASVFFALAMVAYAIDAFFCFAYFRIRGPNFVTENDSSNNTNFNSTNATKESGITYTSNNLDVAYKNHGATYEYDSKQSYPVY